MREFYDRHIAEYHSNCCSIDDSEWVDRKIRHLAWADLPPTANFPPFLAASTRELVTVWVKSPLDWESWVLELSSGNVVDVAFQPKSGVLASLAEDGWIVLWQGAVEAVQVRWGRGGVLLSSLASNRMSASSRRAAG